MIAAFGYEDGMDISEMNMNEAEFNLLRSAVTIRDMNDGVVPITPDSAQFVNSSFTDAAGDIGRTQDSNNDFVYQPSTATDLSWPEGSVIGEEPRGEFTGADIRQARLLDQDGVGDVIQRLPGHETFETTDELFERFPDPESYRDYLITLSDSAEGVAGIDGDRWNEALNERWDAYIEEADTRGIDTSYGVPRGTDGLIHFDSLEFNEDGTQVVNARTINTDEEPETTTEDLEEDLPKEETGLEARVSEITSMAEGVDFETETDPDLVVNLDTSLDGRMSDVEQMMTHFDRANIVIVPDSEAPAANDPDAGLDVEQEGPARDVSGASIGTLDI